MKKITYLILICTLCSCGSKINFINQRLTYDDGNESFEMFFVNDSICKIYSKERDTLVYKYSIIDKEKLLTVKDNQPTVNFKTSTQRNSYMAKMPLKLLRKSPSINHLPFKEVDTLIYLKMKNDKRLFFDNRNKFIQVK